MTLHWFLSFITGYCLVYTERDTQKMTTCLLQISQINSKTPKNS